MHPRVSRLCVLTMCVAATLVPVEVRLVRSQEPEPGIMSPPAQPPAPVSGTTPATQPPVPDPTPGPDSAWLDRVRPRIDQLRPDQLMFGPIVPPAPAHSLAMLEADAPMLGDDPRVLTVAVLLERLTAAYVEDAPRIGALTAGVVENLRKAGKAVSPVEMLQGAAQWKGPGGPGIRGNRPRTFLSFASRYRELRLGDARDHQEALSRMQPAVP